MAKGQAAQAAPARLVRVSAVSRAEACRTASSVASMATMVEACASPAIPPHSHLLAAALDLVARATGGALDPSQLALLQQQLQAGATPAPPPAAVPWAASGEPPVGVVELALKLWRGVVAAVRAGRHAFGSWRRLGHCEARPCAAALDVDV